MIVTISLGGLLANQMQTNLESYGLNSTTTVPLGE